WGDRRRRYGPARDRAVHPRVLRCRDPVAHHDHDRRQVGGLADDHRHRAGRACTADGRGHRAAFAPQRAGRSAGGAAPAARSTWIAAGCHPLGCRLTGRSRFVTALVIIPTYNERRILPHTLRRTRASAPEADVLIVDDASPDGTGQWADGVAAHDPQVHVLHREAKAGLGRAYVAGFTWALQRGYDRVVEMDADGSHHPEDLPRLLAECDADTPLVIGSRWVEGGRTQNWPLVRRLLSRGANRYANTLLGLDVADATAGFRVFTADILERI